MDLLKSLHVALGLVFMVIILILLFGILVPAILIVLVSFALFILTVVRGLRYRSRKLRS